MKNREIVWKSSNLLWMIDCQHGSKLQCERAFCIISKDNNIYLWHIEYIYILREMHESAGFEKDRK